MKSVLFIALILFITSGIAQTKIEVEKRIPADSVPENAQHFIKKHFKAKRLKWYFERNQNHSSFEAKFCEFKKHISVEFSTDGTLEDVEVQIRFKKLEKQLETKIKQTLREEFSNFRILKTQLQFRKYHPEQLQLFFETNTVPKDCFLELIVLGKTETSKNRYEILINSNGEKVSMLQLKEQNQLFLQF